jgi:hypothetical protein
MVCEACWDPETPLQPDSPSVITGCTGCASFKGRVGEVGTINPDVESTNYADAVKGRFTIS